jgi:hypothetical protein
MGIFSFNAWKNSINESLATARARFLKPGFVDQATFDQLKALDPTPTFKYLEKIIGFYLNDKVHIKELGQVVSRFHTLLNRNQVKTRDINAFKSFDQLSSEVQISDQGYSNKQETKVRKKEYDLVHEDKDWIVLIPRTHEASCKYGAGTKWCTSAKEVDHYRKYTVKGITLYYIISKHLSNDDRFYKMAVAVGPNGKKECFNSKDEKIGFEDTLQKSGLSASLFVPNPTSLTLYEKLGLDESKITKNPDGSIDYDGHVDISGLGLDRIPLDFRRVRGSFNCSSNNLTSLEGAPEDVESFDCSRNNLTSLKGAPKFVLSWFYCFHNNLLPKSEKIWARKNINAGAFKWKI